MKVIVLFHLQKGWWRSEGLDWNLEILFGYSGDDARIGVDSHWWIQYTCNQSKERLFLLANQKRSRVRPASSLQHSAAKRQLFSCKKVDWKVDERFKEISKRI